MMRLKTKECVQMSHRTKQGMDAAVEEGESTDCET
jgi:hypothetical protein